MTLRMNCSPFMKPSEPFGAAVSKHFSGKNRGRKSAGNATLPAGELEKIFHSRLRKEILFVQIFHVPVVKLTGGRPHGIRTHEMRKFKCDRLGKSRRCGAFEFVAQITPVDRWKAERHVAGEEAGAAQTAAAGTEGPFRKKKSPLERPGERE